MQSLFEYAAAIHHQPSRMEIVSHRSEQTSWQDQGVTVRHHATTYEVLADGAAAAPVSPRRQAFDNPCRETFWLRYHNA